MDKTVKAHTGEVTAIAHENGKLITGGNDSKVNIYTTKDGECKLEKSIDLTTSHPKSVDYMNGKILVGKRDGSIIEIDEATE